MYMKIKNKKSTLKPLLIVSAILLVIAIGVFSFSTQWWNAAKEVNTTQKTTDVVKTETSQPTSATKDKKDTEKKSESDPKEDGSQDTKEEPPKQNTSTQPQPNPQPENRIPTSPQPSLSAPFPVSTREYVITKTSDTEYTIRLNAILNSPEQYSQYEQQLKAYKKVALDYLSKRTGSTADIKITWIPTNAQNL